MWREVQNHNNSPEGHDMDAAPEQPADDRNRLKKETTEPSINKGSFRRSEKGRIVIHTLARWIVERLQSSGLSFDAWLQGGCKLKDIGVNRASAIAELRPRIPEAHEWYNQSGNGKQYANWEAYWEGSLANRAYYFFHRHDLEKRIVAGVAEWPGTVENNTLIAPQSGVVDQQERLTEISATN
jgi:hypothetical protein